MRDELYTSIQTNIASLTQFNLANELPWSQNGLPLYRKNLKRVYVDEPRIEQTDLYMVFTGDDVVVNQYICPVYVSIDAKNPPSQTQQLITAILAAKTLPIVNFGVESDYTVDLQEDVQTYTFEFRMNVATT